MMVGVLLVGVIAVGPFAPVGALDPDGFVLVDSSGAVSKHGDPLPVEGVAAAAVVGLALTPDGTGAWYATAAGDVHTTGSAENFGSMAGSELKEPVVGIAATPTGLGYWLVALDGGVFSFGDAEFYGSTGDLALNAPVVNLAPSHAGRGYWLVALDGGVFAFGDARFHGSMGAVALNRPVGSIVAGISGSGYLLVALDGGIFMFGEIDFHGSLGGAPPASPVVAAVPTQSGGGYWLATSSGEVFAFGDAPPLAGRIASQSTVIGLATPWASSNAGGPLMLGLIGGVTGIGDSILWVSGNELVRALPTVEISLHAKIGRTFGTGLAIAGSIASTDGFAETVVIGLGTNGLMSQRDLDEMLDLIGPHRRVLLVNVRIPSSWEDSVNARLQLAADARPNIELVDWHTRTSGRPDWFISDGFHPNDSGIAQYVNLLAGALGYDVAPDAVVPDVDYLADIGEE